MVQVKGGKVVNYDLVPDNLEMIRMPSRETYIQKPM